MTTAVVLVVSAVLSPAWVPLVAAWLAWDVAAQVHELVAEWLEGP